MEGVGLDLVELVQQIAVAVVGEFLTVFLQVMAVVELS
jgi:hypothetical protein